MTKRTMLTSGLAGLLGVLLLSAPAVAAEPAAASPAWIAVAASGGVEARAAMAVETAWQAVQRGDQLPSRTSLRTSKRGRATLTRHASVLIVDPNSELELPEQDAADGETSVVQTAGSVVYEVERRARPHFEVVTPHLVAGVKGTSFLVTVTDAFTAVTVESGLVEVLNPTSGAIADVRAGESVFVSGIGGRLDPVDYREAVEPDARREAKRMARMERREDARLERAHRVDDTDPPGAGLTAKADTHGAEVDWVEDSDAAKHGDDGKAGGAAGEVGWEEEVFGQDEGKGKEEPGGDEKPEPPQVDDPIDLPAPPVDDPTHGGTGHGGASKLNRE